jgi:hypothetical protein
MRARLTTLIFVLGATGSQAQFALPFATYEPTPAYLGVRNNMNCDVEAAPYEREGRRGQQPQSAPSRPECPSM